MLRYAREGLLWACGLLVCLLLGTGEAQAASFGIESVTSSGNETSSGNSWGYRFRAEADLEVVALALYDVDGDGTGFTGGYDVHLWTDAGALLSTVRIQGGTSSPIQDGFRYESIASVFLDAGSIYVVSVDFGDDDQSPEFIFNPASMTTNVNVTVLQSTGTATAGLTDFGLRGANNTFPTTTGVAAAVGGNIMFNVVPEPGTGLLLLLGLALLARRRP